ncbi:hypothetical protein [Sphingopyxis sp. PET50]|uniref:hypothetical protein n=1 Tax=Sphingopyxis sp. PET50 TaxID=2976533 RepID=UPI0021AE762D|nr:hypothetical protein [Sphingopyxis sp. PET50]
MIRKRIVIAALIAAALPVAPALAGWKLVPAGQPVAVAKSGMTVTPGEDWNRWTARPIKTSEVWTLDGTSLNELYFVAGLAEGKTLFRDIAKKDRPLPKFSKAMLLPDVVEFFESSTRTALQTSLFEIDKVEPDKMSGHDAVRFAFTYAVEGDQLPRKGIAKAAVVNGQLYLVSFVAPSIHYFDRDAAKVNKLLDTVKI